MNILIKLYIASFLILLLVLVNKAYGNKSIELKECHYEDSKGIMINGTCVSFDVDIEYAIFKKNRSQYIGGNELKEAVGVVETTIAANKFFRGKTLDSIGFQISIIPQSMVTSYADPDKRNFHNENYFRADGYVNRPYLLSKLEFSLNYSPNNKGKFSIGQMEANGLNPLDAKKSQYYLTRPYGLFMRHDKGFEYEHESEVQMRNEVKSSMTGSFGLMEGDGARGQRDVNPVDSRANSYPSPYGSMELRVSHKNSTELYAGITGTRGDTGSHPGEKRRQDDRIRYLGAKTTLNQTQVEMRVFDSKYKRNPEFNGDGRHTEAVISEARGGEISLNKLNLKHCALSLYLAYSKLKNESGIADGEINWGKNTEIKQWVSGANCENLFGHEDFDIHLETGRFYFDKPETLNVHTPKEDALLPSGFILNFSVRYKFGT